MSITPTSKHSDWKVVKLISIIVLKRLNLIDFLKFKLKSIINFRYQMSFNQSRRDYQLFHRNFLQTLRIWLASNLIMNIESEGVVNLKKANISVTKGMARIELYKMDWPNFLLWLSQYKFDWLPWTFDYCAAVLGRWGFSLQDIGKLHHSTSLFSSKISFLFTSKLLTKTVDVI